MARIPADELDRIKRETDLVALVEARGVALRRHGADLIGLCPWHEDHEPSLVVTPGKNLWHCLGACQTGGSVIDWVMRSEGVSFRHAAEILRQDVVPATIRRQKVGKESSVRHLASPVEAGSSDDEILQQVVSFYRETARTDSKLQAYLEKRGLAHPDVLDQFDLGYANRTLAYRLPVKKSVEGVELRSRLQAAGILRESGHEHFSGSLVVPVFDEDGTVVEMYGRKLLDNLRKGTPKHLYLPGPRRGIWNRAALASKELILCESLIDALTFWVNGFGNVTSAYGVEGFTPEMLDAFVSHGVGKVLVAYDRDEAGDRASEKLAKRLQAAGLACYRIQFPRGMDANAYALAMQPALKALDLAIRSATWLGNGKRPDRSRVEVSAGSSSPFAAPPKPAAAGVAQVEPASISPLAARPAEPAAAAAAAAGTAGERAAKERKPAESIAGLVTLEDDEAVFLFDERRYRVRGFAKATAQAMRVNVLASREGIELDDSSPISGIHVETLDLYVDRARRGFEKAASRELAIQEEAIRRDLGRLLLALEGLASAAARKALEPKAKPYAMSEEEKVEALELLRAPDLVERIPAALDRCGLVGERTNKVVLYLACVSRLLERPLAVIVQSSSAAGKSALMDAVLELIPAEAKKKYVAMSGQALFYFSEKESFRHKVLALAEEEGAEKASYPLKMMQSEGRLTMAATGKDGKTGEFETKEYEVEGPMALVQTTTSIELDEELQNRCLVLTVDESREQTRAIHAAQRERRTLEGLWARREKDAIVRVHHNAQRLLRPLAVLNPYASRLTFLDEKTRLRRDHEKYLTLIDAIALLHQHQRPVKSDTREGVTLEYVEVEPGDIELANRLASEVLGRTLDELPPQTRRFLEALHALVAEGCRREGVAQSELWVRRREIREATGWSDTQVWLHLTRLVTLEYVVAHHAPRGRGYVYELLYEGQGRDGGRFLLGLIASEKLRRPSPNIRPLEPNIRGSFGPDSGAIRGGFGVRNVNAGAAKSAILAISAERSLQGAQGNEVTTAVVEGRRYEEAPAE